MTERLPDGEKRGELVNGQLIALTPAAHKHALVSSELWGALFIHCKRHDLGRVLGPDAGYLLHVDPDTGLETVRVPDVSFIRKERETKLFDDIYIGAPDLAVEVLTPDETYRAIRERLHDYFSYGVRLVWLVYLSFPVIDVFTAEANGITLSMHKTLTGGDVVPGFELPVRDVFATLS